MEKVKQISLRRRSVPGEDRPAESQRRSFFNRLIGLGPKGEPFEFAVNIFSDSQFAGACFSPDGEILFANIPA